MRIASILANALACWRLRTQRRVREPQKRIRPARPRSTAEAPMYSKSLHVRDGSDGDGVGTDGDSGCDGVNGGGNEGGGDGDAVRQGAKRSW